MKSFVTKSSGSLGQPSDQNIRKVSLAAQEHKSKQHLELRKSSRWSTDASSVADTTTASFPDHDVKLEHPDQHSPESGDSESDDNQSSDQEPEPSAEDTYGQESSFPNQNAIYPLSKHSELSRHNNVGYAAGSRGVGNRPFTSDEDQWQLPRRTKAEKHIHTTPSRPAQGRARQLGSESEAPTPPTYGLRKPREDSIFGGSELEHDWSEHSSVPRNEPRSSAPAQNQDLDYSHEELKKKRFHDLSNEPFEVDPHGPTSTLPDEMSQGSLLQKLSFLHSHIQSKDVDDSSLKDFFNAMTIDDWDATGDEIIGQLQKVMDTFRQVRREKRQAAMEFEKEVASRQEEVTVRKDLLGQDLHRLKRQGQDVISGTN